MKLRIQDNSIRLRLTQTEVNHIAQGRKVQSVVSFGRHMPTFTYSLIPEGEGGSISVTYHDHELRVSVPRNDSQQWSTTDQVGMEETIAQEEGQSLFILIEKDFQCLHKRPMEDESDHFPNPAAS